MAFSKRDWEKLIRNLSKDSRRVFLSSHALIQMKRRNITQEIVFDVIQKGTIHAEPEPDIKTGDMKCTMQRFTAGRPIGVVVACEDENAVDCLVITAFIIGD
jgi:hypothetical protein